MQSNPSCVLLATLLVAGLLSTAQARQDRTPDCPDCNVVLISIDTLRADHLGCYGYPKDTTPHLDAFSRSSVLFRTAIAQAPSTTASHASIFTSLIPAHHGASRAKHQPISGQVTTMAESLKAAGYRTVSYNGGGQVAGRFGFERGFEIYESKPGRFSDKVQKATRWIQRHPEEKFFLFLHTYEVHAPYDPPAKLLELFDADYTGGLDDTIQPGLLIEINDGRRRIDEEDLRHIVNAYDAGIRSMDLAFGSLVRFLDGRELLDKTIIIFTSDHGEEFGEHAQIGRHSNSLYDELLRVPLIIRSPGRDSAAQAIDTQVRSIDILPTVTTLLGLKRLAQYDGSSLTSLMDARKDGDRIAVSQMDTAQERPTSSIRTGSAKLIFGTHSFVEGAYRWFERKVEFSGPTYNTDLRIESFHEPRRVRISVDGKSRKEAVILPRKQPLSVPVSPAGARITIESTTPCTRPEAVGLDLGLPCVSFRVFNPYEFFVLEADPAERHNLFDDAAHRAEVSRLRRQLDAILESRRTPAETKIEIDARTRERLRALGYLD